jgi:seryl-tRNA synthetase
MIDLKHLIDNTDVYTQELKKRFMQEDLAEVLKAAYGEWKERNGELEKVRQEKNQFNEVVIKLSGDEKAEAIAQMKVTSEKLKSLEGEVKELKEKVDELVYKIPNLTWSGIPVGKDDSANVETSVYGTKPNFSFAPKNYFELPVFKRDYLGEKGVEAVGSRGYFITGELSKFQRVLFNWVLDRLIEKNFEYVIPPIMVNEKVMYGTGFFPSGKNDYYTVNPDEDNLFLVGSSEPSLMFMESGNVLNLDAPKKLTAWTTCFRREAGTYGKDTKGGIRVHQFEKVETVLLCKPEDSEQVFDYMTEVFHETLNLLDLYYHDLEVSSGDQSLKNNRMIDIEAWFPAQDAFREVCSSSNCTDYQTRNLNIRYEDKNGDLQLAHSLNCTGITNRTMFAIMEQFQQEDGRVKVPQVLVEKFGKEYLE